MNIFTQPVAASKCIHQDNALNAKQTCIVSVACPGIATQAGYCNEHQYAAALLERAHGYGWPELLPPKNRKTQEREGLIIRRGYASWALYCEVVSPENAQRITARLEEQCKKGAA